jgi:hypothetical protein
MNISQRWPMPMSVVSVAVSPKTSIVIGTLSGVTSERSSAS